MCRKPKIFWFIVNIWGIIGTKTYGQTISSLPLSERVYTSLEQLADVPPDSVRHLSLKKQKLKELPQEILQFHYLQTLDLSGNRFSVFPCEVTQFSQLRVLDLSANKFDTLPPEIGKLKQLRKLILNRTELYELPREIGLLQQLEYLDIWGTHIARLPEEITQLKNLKELDMRVIVMNQEEQASIKAQLPWVDIKFSKPCNCGF